jgi:hypothetical protein
MPPSRGSVTTPRTARRSPPRPSGGLVADKILSAIFWAVALAGAGAAIFFASSAVMPSVMTELGVRAGKDAAQVALVASAMLTGLLAIPLSILLTWALREAIVRPVLLAMVLLKFHVTSHNQPLDPAVKQRLREVSDRLDALETAQWHASLERFSIWSGRLEGKAAARAWGEKTRTVTPPWVETHGGGTPQRCKPCTRQGYQRASRTAPRVAVASRRFFPLEPGPGRAFTALRCAPALWFQPMAASRAVRSPLRWLCWVALGWGLDAGRYSLPSTAQTLSQTAARLRGVEVAQGEGDLAANQRVFVAPGAPPRRGRSRAAERCRGPPGRPAFLPCSARRGGPAAALRRAPRPALCRRSRRGWRRSRPRRAAPPCAPWSAPSAARGEPAPGQKRAVSGVGWCTRASLWRSLGKTPCSRAWVEESSLRSSSWARGVPATSSTSRASARVWADEVAARKRSSIRESFAGSRRSRAPAAVTKPWGAGPPA